MFTFRALSPDNDTEIRKLIGLYKSIHQENYPINQVYDLRFWKSHIGTKLISVGIYHEKELLGHFAIKNDPRDPSLKRICLCVLAPMSPAENAITETGLSDFLKKYAEKNNIRALYSFTYANHWIDSDIGLRQIGGTDCLLCPRYVPETHSKAFIKEAEKGEHISVLITALITQPPKDLYLANLGPHDEISKEVINKLGFNIIKSTGLESSEVAVSSYENSKMNASHYYIRPSALKSPEETIKELNDCKNKTVLSFIDLSDPSTAEFCEMLDNAGNFRMCGISPLHGDQNSLVYFREERIPLPSFKAFNSPEFLDLYTHISEYKSSTDSNVVVDLDHAV